MGEYVYFLIAYMVVPIVLMENNVLKGWNFTHLLKRPYIHSDEKAAFQKV